MAIFNSKFEQSIGFRCIIDMQIIYILNNIWSLLVTNHKISSKNDLDARYWVQNILLKNHLKSLNKNN